MKCYFCGNDVSREATLQGHCEKGMSSVESLGYNGKRWERR